ncbi:hypothetical protein GYMLUDRAFT_32601 [Collybiopsis luxurians FD-317 M1]|nr:hypothetical protein GYMLUDRAFT_32601 [Collybiopsis luxurians FD-317 M1]
MALCMLIPKLQIWEGVLITAADVLFLLALKDPLRGRPVRVFELSMAILVLAVLICMCIIIIRVNVQWDLAFQGYLPSKYIFPNGAFYTSVGILGATVMPHSLFLGSALATQDRESSSSPPPIHPQPEVSDTSSSTSTVFISQDDSNATQKQPESHNSSRCKFLLIKFCRVIRLTRLILTQALKTLKSSYTVESIKTRHGDRENNSLDFVERHLYHGIVDVVGSLLGFAVIINSMILIISSAVFFYGNKTGQLKSTAGLFDAYDLIQVSIGEGAAKLFAIALLAAGQSSSIVATIAGQAVAEGFLRWRVSPVIRRLFTRVIAIIPSMVVAIVFGRPGIDALLVISQVILSVVLPFVTLPLLYLTSTKQIMTVKAIPAIQLSRHGKALDGHTQVVQSSPCATRRHLITNGCHDIHNETIETFNDPASTESRSAVENVEAHTHELDAVDFSNGLTTTFFACTVWLLIAAANVYVLVALGMGQS